MRLSHYLRNFLFESFSPGFCPIFWSTVSSMSCKVGQKPEKKSFKNQNFFNSEIVS